MLHRIKNLTLIYLVCLLSFSITPVISNGATAFVDTIIGSQKQCNFVNDGLYKPFSDIDNQFPVFGELIQGNNRCVKVSNSVPDLFDTGFKVFLGIVSLLAVVRISYAGIQWMIQDKSGAKTNAREMLTNSIIGLVLALSAWLILNTVNPRALNLSTLSLQTGALSSLGGLIQSGINQAEGNIAQLGSGGCIQGTTGCSVESGGVNMGTGNTGGAIGTMDPTGAIRPNEAPTVFGYRDGDGTVGNTGDNGLGNGLFSPISGWTYYTGGAHNPSGDANNYAQGVAVPMNTLISDFGSVENVKNGAYEIFKNGVSIGAYPIVDNSSSKLDLTYGLVKAQFDPNITSSNSWSGAGQNITYKPLPNYWVDHQRPAQPMVRDNFSGTPNASTVDQAATNPATFRYQ